MVGTMNRLQQAYSLDHGQFLVNETQVFQELGLKPPEKFAYRYRVQQTAQGVLHYAEVTPEAVRKKSFLGWQWQESAPAALAR
ncbi:MAG: type IV pilin-like G/H family protein [Synechococcales bacterium]|nr:type IV pilin-like G/H family protein [Synechococcales bacterium]